MQIFRDKYQPYDGGDDVEVELVADPEQSSSALHHSYSDAELGGGSGSNGAAVYPNGSGDYANGNGGDGSQHPARGLQYKKEGGAAPTRKWAKWAAIGGGVAVALVLISLALKLELDTTRLSSSPRSACSFTGPLIPPELVVPEQYNVTVNLQWQHFLTVRQQDPPSSFQGRTATRFRALRSTECVIMHSRYMNFSEVRVAINGGTEKCLCGSGCLDDDCSSIIYPAKETGGWRIGKHGMVIVDLATRIDKGDSLVLTTAYTGQLGTHLNGLARSEAFRYGSEQSHLLSTQFKESHAREVFPCLDEPQYRSQYVLSVEVPPPMVTLSTMPVAAEAETVTGLKLVTFQPTPPMPPHLLSLCVGRLKGKSVTSGGGVNITAWGPPSLEELGEVDLALQAAKAAYDYYTSYFGVKLPLPKLDMVAVPGRKHAEPHWGLALFDERRFLYNTESEGAYDQVLAANVVCHHLALQWFGGYVSPATWAELAAADGIAGLLAYDCMSIAHPHISGRALFQLGISPMGEAIGVHEGPQSQALVLDADPIGWPLVPPEGASPPPGLGIAKGAALFAMLRDYSERVTPGAFQAGLQLYLQRHALGNGTMADLTGAVAEALLTRGAQAHRPPPLCLPTCLQTRKQGDSGSADAAAVEAAVNLMLPYFSLAGYPTVFAEQDVTKSGTIDFEQQRFLAWPAPEGAVKPTADPPHWWMPLALGEFVAGKSQHQVQYVEFAQPSHSIELPQVEHKALETHSWVVKRGGLGLYRATYDGTQMTSLMQTLSSLTVEYETGGDISPDSLERLLSASALLDDAFAATLAGNKFHWEFALQLAEAASKAPAAATGFGQYLLLIPVIKGLEALKLRLRANAPCMTALSAFEVKLLASSADAALQHTANEQYPERRQDSFLMALSKSNVLTTAALAGDTLVADALCGMYKNNTLHHHAGHLTGGVPLDVRGAAYIAAVAQPPGCRDEPERQLILDENHWRKEHDEREDLRYLYAMPYAANATDLYRALRLAFGIQSTTRKVAEPQDQQRLLHLVAANPVGGKTAWQFLTDNWPTISYEHGYSVYHTLMDLPVPSTAGMLGEVRKFFAVGGSGHAIPHYFQDRLLGRLAAEVAWVDEHELGICAWLAAHKP